MTIAFPDVSNYQHGLRIQPGTVAVVAKATEGTYYKDASFYNFEAQADTLGSVFSGYHYLRAGNGAAQADYYRTFTTRPCMIDVEANSGGVPDVLSFMDRAAGNGTRVWGVYLPHWYWQQIGSPDLTPIAQRGAVLVSSNYTSYSDTGPGWAPYGGMTPIVWQYTSSQLYGGQAVDFNAYRGTVDQFRTLVLGTQPAPTPTPTGTNMLTDADVYKIWAFRNLALDSEDMRQRLVDAATDAAGAQSGVQQLLTAVAALIRNLALDSEDMRQRLVDAATDAAGAQSGVQQLLTAVAALQADVTAIKAKVGA